MPEVHFVGLAPRVSSEPLEDHLSLRMQATARLRIMHFLRRMRMACGHEARVGFERLRNGMYIVILHVRSPADRCWEQVQRSGRIFRRLSDEHTINRDPTGETPLEAIEDLVDNGTVIGTLMQIDCPGDQQRRKWNE